MAPNNERTFNPAERPDFRCRACGCDRYVPVEARRDGNWVRTPFYRCCGCSVMFHDPLDFSGLRTDDPEYEIYRRVNLPGSKPMIPPAPNPFMPRSKRTPR